MFDEVILPEFPNTYFELNAIRKQLTSSGLVSRNDVISLESAATQPTNLPIATTYTTYPSPRNYQVTLEAIDALMGGAIVVAIGVVAAVLAAIIKLVSKMGTGGNKPEQRKKEIEVAKEQHKKFEARIDEVRATHAKAGKKPAPLTMERYTEWLKNDKDSAALNSDFALMCAKAIIAKSPNGRIDFKSDLSQPVIESPDFKYNVLMERFSNQTENVTAYRKLLTKNLESDVDRYEAAVTKFIGSIKTGASYTPYYTQPPEQLMLYTGNKTANDYIEALDDAINRTKNDFEKTIRPNPPPESAFNRWLHMVVYADTVFSNKAYKKLVAVKERIDKLGRIVGDLQGAEKDHAIQQLRLVNQDSKVLFKQIQFYNTFANAVDKSAKRMSMVDKTVDKIAMFVLAQQHKELIK